MAVRRVVPDLHADAPAEVAAFLGRVFGMQVVMDQGWIVTVAHPAAPQAQISVMSGDATAEVVPDLSIEVDDVDAAFVAAVRAGAEIAYPMTTEPWGVRRFFLRTPAGHVLNVLGHVHD